VYSRDVRGSNGKVEERSFGVSGKLWNGVLVMYDRESGTLWTQLDGRGIKGPDAGQRLHHVASVFTTWGEWKAAHPDTLVLEKDPEEALQKGSHYEDYFADPDRLFFPGLGDDLPSIHPKDTVFGVLLGTEALAVTESYLVRDGLANVVVAHRPVALLRNAKTGEVRGVERRKGGAAMILEPVDGAPPTRTVRDTLTGKTVSPADLPPVRVDRAFWYAWSRSHPSSQVLLR